MMLDVEFPGPILIFKVSRLGEAINELYNMDYYPMSIITDNKNPVLIEARENFPEEKIECIIIPCRYIKKFLA